MRAVGEALGLGRTLPGGAAEGARGRRGRRRAAGDPRPPSLLRRRARVDPRRRARARRERGRPRGEALRASGRAHRRRPRRLRGGGARRGAASPGRLAVDSCAGEFEARTPYYYLSHEAGDGDGTPPGAIVVLGSGTNRIGQGIEFDYCCVHAAQAFRRLGHEVVLVNSNPETVSTDYDTCDRLYLEPVTLERVLDVVELERPLGVVVSLGGQTPLGLAAALAEAGVPLLGDPLRRDRRWPRTAAASARCSTELGVRAPAWGVARDDRRRPARSRSEIGYPVLVRPSYVLGGRGMRVAREPRGARARRPGARRSLPRGRARARRRRALRRRGRLGRVRSLEHVERAGVHSGDSACVAAGAVGRPRARGRDPRARVDARARPRRPRACSTSSSRCTTASCTCSRRTRARRARSRSSSKATGIPLVDHACRLLLGASLAELGLPERVVPDRAPGRRRRSSPPSASPAPPTAASRCARPAR